MGVQESDGFQHTIFMTLYRLYTNSTNREGSVEHSEVRALVGSLTEQRRDAVLLQS